jgi:hypothetical protein
MTLAQRRPLADRCARFLAAAGTVFILACGGANAAEIDVNCGIRLGDPISIRLNGEILTGDAERLRGELNRCLANYDLDGLRRQADALTGGRDRNARAALNAKADAVESLHLIFGAPAVRLYLDSSGGDLAEAMRIGRLAREQRLTTVVDVDHRKCVDACLLAFAGGVVRRMSWSADVRINLTDHGGSAMSDEITGYLTSMGIPDDAARRLSKGPPLRLGKVSAFDLGISGADPAYVRQVESAYVDAWGNDSTEIMEAAAAYQGVAKACARRQDAVDPIDHGFVACVMEPGDRLQTWQRYLHAIAMIDALQASGGRHGLPDHRLFAEIAGDWGF